MGAAVYGGRGFKGKGKGEVARGPWAPPSTEGEGSKERGKGKWREAHGRRRLRRERVQRKGERGSGERPMGAAGFRQQYNQASCNPPSPSSLLYCMSVFLFFNPLDLLRSPPPPQISQ